MTLTDAEREYVHREVTTWPEFTAEQAALLRRVLSPGVERRVRERAERGAA